MAQQENEVNNLIRQFLLDEGWGPIIRINSGFKGVYAFYHWYPAKSQNLAGILPQDASLKEYKAWQKKDSKKIPYTEGVSDILALRFHDGLSQVLFVEGKTREGKASDMQEFFLACAGEAGAFTIIPKGYEDFLMKYWEMF